MQHLDELGIAQKILTKEFIKQQRDNLWTAQAGVKTPKFKLKSRDHY